MEWLAVREAGGGGLSLAVLHGRGDGNSLRQEFAPEIPG